MNEILVAFISIDKPNDGKRTGKQNRSQKADVQQRRDSEERRIGFKRALVRSIFLFVPFELNHSMMFHLIPHGMMPPPTAFMGITFVWVVIFTYLFSIKFTTEKQSIHDLIAKTFVISKI